MRTSESTHTSALEEAAEIFSWQELGATLWSLQEDSRQASGNDKQLQAILLSYIYTQAIQSPGGVVDLDKANLHVSKKTGVKFKNVFLAGVALGRDKKIVQDIRGLNSVTVTPTGFAKAKKGLRRLKSLLKRRRKTGSSQNVGLPPHKWTASGSTLHPESVEAAVSVNKNWFLSRREEKGHDMSSLMEEVIRQETGGRRVEPEAEFMLSEDMDISFGNDPIGRSLKESLHESGGGPRAYEKAKSLLKSRKRSRPSKRRAKGEGLGEAEVSGTSEKAPEWYHGLIQAMKACRKGSALKFGKGEELDAAERKNMKKHKQAATSGIRQALKSPPKEIKAWLEQAKKDIDMVGGKWGSHPFHTAYTELGRARKKMGKMFKQPWAGKD